MTDVLYFPFLNPDPGALGRMRSLFPELFLLTPFSEKREGEEGDGIKYLVPENLDGKRLRILIQDFRERMQLLGRDAFSGMFQADEGESSSPALASEILGQKTPSPSEEGDGDLLIRSAFFLLESETFDQIQQDVSKDLLEVERARKSMMAALRGEEDYEIVPLQPPSPCRVEARLRAWMRLLRSCRRIPHVWVTDMPGVAEVLELLFQEGRSEVDFREAGIPEGLFSGMRGRLFRISLLESEHEASFFHESEKRSDFLWIFCLDTVL